MEDQNDEVLPRALPALGLESRKSFFLIRSWLLRYQIALCLMHLDFK